MSPRELLGSVERLSPWETWLSAVTVFVVALIVRIAAARLVVFPTPEDTAYYFGVARNLVDGRGLVSDALWSYQTPPLQLPRAAFEVWLPLPSFLVAKQVLGLGITVSAIGMTIVWSHRTACREGVVRAPSARALSAA